MISAILLAAGQSKRMKGENKLTKKIHGLSLIEHSVKNILSSSIDQLIIVLGHQNKTIKGLIKKNDRIRFALNDNYESGMASSIKIGIDNLPEKTKAFFICLGDMPMVKQNIYNLLIQSKDSGEIIVPTFKGQQGNPVLFSISMKNKIKTIKGDSGAKKIIAMNKNKTSICEIKDESITIDYNTKDSFNS